LPLLAQWLAPHQRQGERGELAIDPRHLFCQLLGFRAAAFEQCLPPLDLGQQTPAF
jgi:hypothetical protein